ncbi:hypothetical protein ACGFIR_31340 [Micromonospora sp. NPDC049051]|uniref:hypothetical protein n=1 Tax=Micromonospora sp. NPDC049051 TaxID=3364264 RepID=UPI003713283D
MPVFAVLTLALPALAINAQPSGTPPQPGAAPARSYWPHQDSLGDAAAAVSEAGPRSWPQTYAGVELNLDGNELIVHRIPSDPAVDQAIRALVPTVRVRLADADHPERQLTAWHAEMISDRPYWHNRGITLHNIGTRTGECVTVGIDNPTRDAAVVIAYYAHQAICIEYAGPPVLLTSGPQQDWRRRG